MLRERKIEIFDKRLFYLEGSRWRFIQCSFLKGAWAGGANPGSFCFCFSSSVIKVVISWVVDVGKKKGPIFFQYLKASSKNLNWVVTHRSSSSVYGIAMCDVDKFDVATSRRLTLSTSSQSM